MNQSFDEVNNIKDKLEFILKAKEISTQRTHTHTHANVILNHYVEDIKNSIQDVTDKINEIYDNIVHAQLDDITNHNNQGYKQLYEKLAIEADGDRAFINTFGPYMTLLQLYLNA